MKKPTITTIASGYYSRQALNTNFENLRDSFDNTLSLDGSTPNSMGADLDMNGNDILNAGTIAVADLTVAGLDVNTALNAAVSASAASAVASDVSAVASEASAQASAASASSAALYDGPWIDDVATLLADTTLTLTPGQPNTVVIGDYVRTRKEGFSYEVVASGTLGAVKNSGAVPVEFIVLPSDDGSYNALAFGAVGDYNPAVETAGQLAVTATNNFDAINLMRQYFEGVLKGGTLVFPAPGDYYSSNMPRFELSNFTLVIERGATIRTTVPTSFGTTILLGKQGVTSNVKITGGGTVRNYLPDLATTPLWLASTAYAVGDYVKNSVDQIYYCFVAGTSGGSEPTVIAGSEVEGTVTWKDALNDNGVSLAGDYATAEDIYVAEASNKAFTQQSAPWIETRFIRCRVGSTHLDGIEIKGNQGTASADFGNYGFIQDCVIEDAGRRGISITQAATGSNLNRNMTVTGNTVISNGTRYGTAPKQHVGIYINRAANVYYSNNRVLAATGNGVHFRQCSEITGDVLVEGAGIYGLHMQENDGFAFTSTVVLNGDAAYAAIRETNEAGLGDYGVLRVEGGVYTYAFEEVGRTGRSSARAVQLAIGSSGRVNGTMPTVPAPSITNSESDEYTLSQSSVLVGATGRTNIISEATNAVQVISGSVTGNAACRVEIIINGVVGTTLTFDANSGEDSSGGVMRTFSIPPIYAPEGMTLRVNNNSGAANTIGWSVLYRVL